MSPDTYKGVGKMLWGLVSMGTILFFGGGYRGIDISISCIYLGPKGVPMWLLRDLSLYYIDTLTG